MYHLAILISIALVFPFAGDMFAGYLATFTSER